MSVYSPSAKGLAYVVNNGKYVDEYNDKYLCCDFLSASIFGPGYHSRYQNFKFTGINTRIIAGAF